MADPNHTYYNVKVELDPIADNNGSSKVVIWNSGSSEFDLTTFHSSDICFPYVYQTTLGVTNGEAQLRSNLSTVTSNPTAANFLIVDDVTSYGSFIGTYFNNLGNGLITIREINNPTPTFAIYQVTSATDEGSYFQFNISLISSNGSFTNGAELSICGIPQDKCVVEIKAGPQGYLISNPTVAQYGMFSRDNDSTCSETSGSDAFVARSLRSETNTDASRDQEFTFTSGSDSKTIMIGSNIPIRLQYDEEFEDNVDYPLPAYPTVPASYEYMFATRSGALNVGQKTNFASFQVPSYMGSSSYTHDNYANISQSFGYARIHHTAMSATSTVQRTQVCTHHIVWNKDENGVVVDTTVNSIEEARIPVNQVIIDPSLTSASWNDGNLRLSIYHYNVDNAYHVFKYTLL